MMYGSNSPVFAVLMAFVAAVILILSLSGILEGCTASQPLLIAQAKYPSCVVKEIESKGNRTTVLVQCPFQSDKEVVIVEK